jgi:multiple sugar transport system ATP-binding protein
MRAEIILLRKKIDTTFVYVTHDQTEAMTLGDRIVIMKDGLIQQVGTPTEVFEMPDNLFVAEFIGAPKMNVLSTTLTIKDGKYYVNPYGVEIEVDGAKGEALAQKGIEAGDVILGVRPDDIHDEQIFIESSPDTIIEGYVDVLEKLGSENLLYLNIDGKEGYTIARVDPRSSVQVDTTVKFAIDVKHIHIFDAETQQTLLAMDEGAEKK